MTEKTSSALKLYGTEEFVEPMRTLVAGPLTCEFDQGALRFIRIYEKEAIRNIAFVVRDKDWGTYPPALANLHIDQQVNSFTVAFDAICKDEHQEIHYTARITGAADGSLSFTSDYTTPTGFLTNRTGFVILHPLQGVSGHSVIVENVDGSVKNSEFPMLVDPVQPFKNIRALTHEVMPGVSVCCRMTGDTFEMEDHRQWNDASYKTYVRPIALPWPYTLPASYSHQQTVSLSITDHANQNSDSSPENADQRCVVTIKPAEKSLRMPGIGLGLEPQHLSDAHANLALLKQLSVQQLVMWYQLEKHGDNALELAGQLAREINANLVLHAVIPDKDYKSEVAELARRSQAADLALSAISVTPSKYLCSIMPGTTWPDVTSLGSLYDEVRSQFPGVMLGGGMLSFFPELNRHRPPIEQLDYITHASNTITHASDDISVTENLEALPYIINTCRSFTGEKPYHIGPSSIGMRFNPYGSRTMENPNNTRIAMARMDPRQRGLINAAWSVGYLAHAARGGLDWVNLHAPTGEFGVIYHPQEWPQPGFDGTDRLVFPAYHTIAGFAQGAGKIQRPTHSSMRREIEAVAYEDNGKCIMWMANMTSDLHTVEIRGLTNKSIELTTLSLDTFDTCTESATGFEQASREVKPELIELGPYTVVRLISPAN